jgi:hypothetical protein
MYIRLSRLRTEVSSSVLQRLVVVISLGITGAMYGLWIPHADGRADPFTRAWSYGITIGIGTALMVFAHAVLVSKRALSAGPVKRLAIYIAFGIVAIVIFTLLFSVMPT